jgi:tripartite-type tricarboxylate transporter receptor subunit TctC
MKSRTLLSLCAVLATLAAAPAHAQSYPAHPVTILVPFGAGGGSDLLARLVAQRLEQRLH